MNKKSIKYPLSFTEALEVLMKNEGWIQGDNFADGVVFKLDESGLVKHCDFLNKSHDREINAMLTIGVYSQNYRIVHTQPDAERRI